MYHSSNTNAWTHSWNYYGLLVLEGIGENMLRTILKLVQPCMGEGTCQLDILDRPSWGCELTSETFSIGGP